MTINTGPQKARLAALRRSARALLCAVLLSPTLAQAEAGEAPLALQPAPGAVAALSAFCISGPAYYLPRWSSGRAVLVESRMRFTQGEGAGLMLTADAALVEASFELVWTVDDALAYSATLADPETTVRAAAAAAMRDVAARTPLAAMDASARGAIAEEARAMTQETLDRYISGVRIERLSLLSLGPPAAVREEARLAQAAEQESAAEALAAEHYAERRIAEARGRVSLIEEEADAYFVRRIAAARAEAARFETLRAGYRAAADETARALYLQSLELMFAP